MSICAQTQKSLSTQTQKRFSTVSQMPGFYPAFSQPAIRWLIYNENKNGFSQCIRRIGGKILIDLDCFEAWINGHQKQEDVAS